MHLLIPFIHATVLENLHDRFYDKSFSHILYTFSQMNSLILMHYSFIDTTFIELTSQSESLQCPSSSRLEQLSHDTVGLSQVTLNDRDPATVTGQ